jgi:quercetin dioxygenase-like cupin family protein
MAGARAARVLGPEEGHWLSWQGQPIRYTALGQETGGFYASSWGMVPPGSGPAPHRHTFHEGFYILRGEITFTTGNRSVHLSTGGFLNVAAGTAHFFKNTGTEDAELLVVVAPAGFDRFQFEVGRPADGPAGPFLPASPWDDETMKAVAPRYGIDLNPPPSAFRLPPCITVKQPGQGRSFAVAGDLYTFLAVGEDTDGAYALWHAIVPPGGGPPPHLHTLEEEAFYVLEGRLALYAEDRRATGGPGTFVHLPRGSLHRFKNESTQPARMLILAAPAGLEKMFEETGRPWPDVSRPPPPMSTDEIARLLTVAPRYGIDIRAGDSPQSHREHREDRR